MRFLLIIAALLTALLAPVASRASANEAAVRAAYLDKEGVVRWRDTNREVALFGANYCIMSSSDYRMSGLISQDRKKMIDEDMAQFARMGWNALRLCSWGDSENADRDGNLIANDHVDLMDYLIAKARERGIYILLTPIHGSSPGFPDQLNKPPQYPGFSKNFARSELGTNPKAIAAQVNYIGQLLNHVNPYTGVALKDEPAILFIEMINEQVNHPEDLPGSVTYINALVKAVRDTGSKAITFYNVSQDFRIAEAIKESHVDGASFGWYPSGLVSGHTLKGNFLQAVDAYPDMLRPELNGRPRIMYEFDTADMATGYMYPAMVRTYRSVGAQFATMFAYDMLETAPYNLGWQTHYLNLVHAPKKAVSAVIAAEAMKRLPRFKSYGRYPDDVRFGDFRVSYDNDMSELVANDVYMNAGDTETAPRDPRKLKRIVGFGSSPLVGYEGTGAYFLDKVRDGVWRLEVYPDEVLVRDPFEQPRPDKTVSRLLYRSWPIDLRLPDLGTRYYANPINVPQDSSATQRRAAKGRVQVEPGIWLLSTSAKTERFSLPTRIDHVGFDEYYVNKPISYPDLVLSLAPKEFRAGDPVEIRARVADNEIPEEVKLWVRPAGTQNFTSAIAMSRAKGNDYAAVIEPAKLPPGLYEYAVTEKTGNRTETFPGGVPQQPTDWPFFSDTLWTFRVTPPGAPLRLLDPKNDYQQLSFVRPEETVRNGLFNIVPGSGAGEVALRFGVPDLGKNTPELYAAEFYIGDAIAARNASRATTLGITLKSAGGTHRNLDVTLIEKDGTSWSASVAAGSTWASVSVPLSDLHISRSIFIPSPFPGLWDYWRETPEHRGGEGDRIHLENVERLQLTVHRDERNTVTDNAAGVAVESVWLNFTEGK